MTGWTAPKAKPRKRFVSRQTVMADKAVERAKIKTYMSAADEHDRNNLAMADYFLRQRADLGEECIQTQWAIRCMARLRPDVEL